MLRRILPLLAVLVGMVEVSAREERVCRDDLLESDGYTIRSVTIEGRWVPSLELPIKAGDRYSNAKIQQALRAVQQALRSDDRGKFELENLGEVGVLHVTRCLLVEGREVDVIIQARSVQIALYEVGENVLPIPRSALATFYEAVPRPLLALNPTFGAYQDKEYGFAPTAGIEANLFELAPPPQSLAATVQTSRLDLIASGRKSLEHRYYDADAELALTMLRRGETLEQLSFNLAYRGTDMPQGSRSFTRQAGEVGGAVRLNMGPGVIQAVHLGGKYRFAENCFNDGGDRADTSEHTAELRLLAEGRAAGGFLRAGLWADAGMPDHGGNYQRVAGLVAMQKEFLLALNQTIGVEAIIGGGKAWSAPAYAQFYGGNSARNFLYDSQESRTLTAFPSGPTIRSFGSTLR